VVLIEGVSIEQEFQTETACKGNTWIQFLKRNIRSDPGPADMEPPVCPNGLLQRGVIRHTEQ